MTDQRNHGTEDLFGFAAVVERLETLVSGPPQRLEDQLVPTLAAAASNPPRTRLATDFIARAAVFVAAFVLAGGGLAAADALPRPLQEAAESLLRTVGVEVGDPHDNDDDVVLEPVDRDDEADDQADDGRNVERPGDGDETDDRDEDESREADDGELDDDELDDDELDDDELDDDESDDDESDDDEPDDDESDD